MSPTPDNLGRELSLEEDWVEAAVVVDDGAAGAADDSDGFDVDFDEQWLFFLDSNWRTTLWLLLINWFRSRVSV